MCTNCSHNEVCRFVDGAWRVMAVLMSKPGRHVESELNELYERYCRYFGEKTFGAPNEETLDGAKKQVFWAAMAKARQNRQMTADILRIGVRSVYRMIKKYGVRPQ